MGVADRAQPWMCLSFSGAWNLPIRLAWLTSEPQGSTRLHLPGDGITCPCYCTDFFPLRILGNQLRSWCLQGKHFNHRAISPSLSIKWHHHQTPHWTHPCFIHSSVTYRLNLKLFSPFRAINYMHLNFLCYFPSSFPFGVGPCMKGKCCTAEPHLRLLSRDFCFLWTIALSS